MLLLGKGTNPLSSFLKQQYTLLQVSGALIQFVPARAKGSVFGEPGILFHARNMRVQVKNSKS